MFELTNDQRRCFALSRVSPDWACVELKAGRFDRERAFAYIDGNVIRKRIVIGENNYSELDFEELLSEDLQYLLPKTAKGKPMLLTAANLQKRRGIGMGLAYCDGCVTLYNEPTECGYYWSGYDPLNIESLDGFGDWVATWCAETSEEDLADITQFAKQKRKHIKYREGDVFRFKINRRLYGYGRILLDYDQMRKRHEPFWDILMCKPLVCSVYHIATDQKDLTVDDLKDLDSLPSSIMADNSVFYGEYEIIGNLPIRENEDYPIMYGNSIDCRETALYFQWGKLYRRFENKTVLHGCGCFRNNGVSFTLNVRLDVLQQCIEEASNLPYWNQSSFYAVNSDLRNPKFQKELERICKQCKVELP